MKIDFLKNTRGQIIIEYILLLVLSVTIALALIKLTDIAQGESNPFFKFWINALEVIGDDIST